MSSYNYCGNNPVLMIDPDGRKYTHYVDKNYNVLLQTDDGSDDIVLIPKNKVKKFMTFFELYTTSQDHSVFDSPGWNQYWKSEFGLADRQFTEGEIAVLNQFSTDWSRNSAAAYLLNPTVANALQMGLSEGLSQWTNIELVAGGLSAGIAGWQSVVSRVAAAKGGKIFFESAKYSDKVLRQMNKTDDILHAFPNNVDGYATMFGQWSTKIGTDGKVYSWLEMSGSYGGKTGVFEYIKNANGVINHRFFKIVP